jgi:hypothetical protein
MPSAGRFVIVYMWDAPSVRNAEQPIRSVYYAERWLRELGFTHQWGMSWLRGTQRALIADRGMHVPMRPVVSLYKAGR